MLLKVVINDTEGESNDITDEEDAVSEEGVKGHEDEDSE